MYDLSAEAVEFAGMGKPAGYDEALFELLMAAGRVLSGGGLANYVEAQQFIDAMSEFLGFDAALRERVLEKLSAESSAEFAKQVERERKVAGKC